VRSAGGVGLDFQISGVAAHSSKPHLGKNALVAASELILRMMEEHELLQTTKGGPLGAPTITPTLAGGGHGPNIVPQVRPAAGLTRHIRTSVFRGMPFC
jgi:metal-dependent amidase/aminoacylase/carboxypeptidase family protein